MKITKSLNDQLMCIAAHRYCLGRSSYIVQCGIDFIRAHWPQFDKKTQSVIVRDTWEALFDGFAGYSIDRQGWHDLVKWANDNIDDNQRAWINEAVCHKGEFWEFIKNYDPHAVSKEEVNDD